MSEYLNLTAGGVDFLSLPAGKITRYPLEARTDGIFLSLP